MSLVRKLILAGTIGLATLIGGCKKDAVDKAPINTESTRYRQGIEKVLADLGKVETITTQITDVQNGFIVTPQDRGGYTFAYEFVKVKGGDANQGMLLIYPHSKYFEKFTPAQIIFKRINNRKITAKEITKRYYGRDGSNNLNYIIEADGIIEPDGVKYLGESK